MFGATSWLFAAAVLLQAPEGEAPKEDTTASWRFKHDDKAVKVVVLAGSVGAFWGQSYAREVERLCRNVEVKNISKVGYGAYPLKRHFRKQVLDNRRLDLEEEGKEFWFVYGGGVNSLGMPYSTNHHIKATIVAAKYLAKMKVIALTVTPWGDEKDRRWRGLAGLGARKRTQLVADFMMQRLTPEQALGSYAGKRPAGKTGPWDPLEVPDISIDLYDSPLRDKDAAPRDIEKMREALSKDASWKREHKDLSEADRAAQLEADAKLLADLPKWYLREDLRSFDHIHPNEKGHAIIAATMCQKLPESWGCTCED
jgi:hypothetical protein